MGYFSALEWTPSVVHDWSANNARKPKDLTTALRAILALAAHARRAQLSCTVGCPTLHDGCAGRAQLSRAAG
eukprot:8025742-Lingulodinium_polyedra.AAC.1